MTASIELTTSADELRRDEQIAALLDLYYADHRTPEALHAAALSLNDHIVRDVALYYAATVLDDDWHIQRIGELMCDVIEAAPEHGVHGVFIVSAILCGALGNYSGWINSLRAAHQQKPDDALTNMMIQSALRDISPADIRSIINGLTFHSARYPSKEA